MVLPILAVQITIDADAAILKALVAEVVDEVEDKENQEKTNGNSNVINCALGTLIPVQEGVHPKYSSEEVRRFRKCSRWLEK